MVRLSDFDYVLPEHLIAQTPLMNRTDSRLLHLPCGETPAEHKKFSEVVDLLRPADALIVNTSMVMKARLIGKKHQTGGSVEVLLVRPHALNTWVCLVRARGKKSGLKIQFQDCLASVLEPFEDEPGAFLVEFGGDVGEIMDQQGMLPLPTYIERNPDAIDESRYQTIYADASLKSSVAAPTAGLHFDESLLNIVKGMGVRIIPVTLHVGPGTFAPVRHEDVSLHPMHGEIAEISEEAASQINQIRANGGRIVCVGTTSVRTIESFALNGCVQPGKKLTRLFITPGFDFQIVDAMITNFHLPKSTLLMLVSAFSGHQRVMAAYRQAIEKEYRFFSYGDACFFEKWNTK